MKYNTGASFLVEKFGRKFHSKKKYSYFSRVQVGFINKELLDRVTALRDSASL